MWRSEKMQRERDERIARFEAAWVPVLIGLAVVAGGLAWLLYE